VQGVEKGTAEEFYGRLLATTDVLHEASRRYAGEGDGVSALACALGSDVAAMSSVVWERLNIAPRAPQREFFQAAAIVAASLSRLEADEHRGSIAEAVIEARERAIEGFDVDLAADVSARFADVEHLEALPMPTAAEIDDARVRLLEGMSPTKFITARRTASGQAMLDAQEARVRGSIGDAIGAAYDSDFLACDAYLVESALAAGDQSLFTVITRSELVRRAVAEIAELPSDFTDAVATVRAAMAEGLGEADGNRLRAAVITV